jgi:purine-binding chemotaxis protein CheW
MEAARSATYAPTDEPAPPTARRARGQGKFLTFFLGEEEYGVEILCVQEIIGLLPITRVPRTPSFVRGVVNLRGRVIPVVDLRLKFGLEEAEATEESCIVVVEVQGVHVGVRVDRVSEVRDIAAADVEDTPDFGVEVETEFLLGIAKTAGRALLLLDLERALMTEGAATSALV